MNENKEFNELVINLEKNGYEVTVSDEYGFLSAKVDGNRIMGVFVNPITVSQIHILMVDLLLIIVNVLINIVNVLIHYPYQKHKSNFIISYLNYNI